MDLPWSAQPGFFILVLQPAGLGYRRDRPMLRRRGLKRHWGFYLHSATETGHPPHRVQGVTEVGGKGTCPPESGGQRDREAYPAGGGSIWNHPPHDLDYVSIVLPS